MSSVPWCKIQHTYPIHNRITEGAGIHPPVVDPLAVCWAMGMVMIGTTHLKAHRIAASLLKKGFFTDASGEPEAA